MSNTGSKIQPDTIHHVGYFLIYFNRGHEIDGVDRLAQRSLETQVRALNLYNRYKDLHEDEADGIESIYLLANYVFASLNERKHYSHAEQLLYRENVLTDVFPDISGCMLIEHSERRLLNIGEKILDYCDKVLTQSQSVQQFTFANGSLVYTPAELGAHAMSLRAEVFAS